MQKQCRKELKARHFFLFNDLLVGSGSRVVTRRLHLPPHKIYGAIFSRRLYSHQHVLPLAEIGVVDVGDTASAPYGIQINHRRKSFLVRVIGCGGE